MEWQSVAFSRDGWVIDDEGARTLRLLAGSRLTIDYKPFAKEAAQSGKTIEIDYQINNTSDYDAECISIAMPYQKGYIGLKVKPSSIMFATRSERNADVQAMSTDDGVRIRLALVISPKKYTYVLNGNTYYLNLVYLYIDGVEARKFAYLLTDSMQIGTGGGIVIGSDKADVDLYSIRVYDSAMDAANVHQDYINALATVGEKSAEKLDNDIYDTLGTTVDFDKVRGKVNVFTFDKPLPAYEYGKSYRPKGTLEIYPKDGNTNLNRLTITNLQLQGQGTSSMLYYLWNWKAKVVRSCTECTKTKSTSLSQCGQAGFQSSSSAKTKMNGLLSLVRTIQVTTRMKPSVKWSSSRDQELVRGSMQTILEFVKDVRTLRT